MSGPHMRIRKARPQTKFENGEVISISLTGKAVRFKKHYVTVIASRNYRKSVEVIPTGGLIVPIKTSRAVYAGEAVVFTEKGTVRPAENGIYTAITNAKDGKVWVSL